MRRPQRVVLATNNPKKLAELRRVVAGAGLTLEVLGLSDLPSYPEPEETERSFDGNALIKARAAARNTGEFAVADDSGLEVDELNGMPGVRSARWAGPMCDDEENNELLLAQLHGVAPERRGARFRCALALVSPEGEERVWSGAMEGTIAEAPRGENGFGYDPLFIPEGKQRTSAELTSAEKDSISHRGKAVRAFVEWLGETQ
ncbi:RdgB/HAM1 family non-canonical purine NTP pyrophosphatase [Tessaracoccus sp. OH4464_COT-324]|uniref:RdgB/HAM1 family non-canonical purine NTP pyrophosphatase n=1 Tax=Tessaracoccus sp. OH4464_COT-324 TaxID=2491059 RepID=UPI000F62DC55|nr:RdgB/HAM1 family non-canonical purine NTP pyrophosphatase [Tessaracoccus sp. OH4464_COT-324]RRD46825.1 RdgB/HAM1 family non-canonical purine NTP pyrophosphatase [Tessaracoccus sp. OH4464_COT-324]